MLDLVDLPIADPWFVPVLLVHGGHEPSFGRTRFVELCDAYLASRA